MTGSMYLNPTTDVTSFTLVYKRSHILCMVVIRRHCNVKNDADTLISYLSVLMRVDKDIGKTCDVK